VKQGITVSLEHPLMTETAATTPIRCAPRGRKGRESVIEPTPWIRYAMLFTATVTTHMERPGSRVFRTGLARRGPRGILLRRGTGRRRSRRGAVQFNTVPEGRCGPAG